MSPRLKSFLTVEDLDPLQEHEVITAQMHSALINQVQHRQIKYWQAGMCQEKMVGAKV